MHVVEVFASELQHRRVQGQNLLNEDACRNDAIRMQVE